MANWTMTAPLPGEQFSDTADVDGYGDAPAADVSFRFQVLEHGLGPVIQTSGLQTTEDTWWSSNLGPPDEDEWPIGLANAVVRTPVGGIQTYVTIEFEP